MLLLLPVVARPHARIAIMAVECLPLWTTRKALVTLLSVAVAVAAPATR